MTSRTSMMQTRKYPGFIDLHVHFRDPGMPKAETRATGAAAAYKAGFAAVVTMPNTSPAGDNVAWVREQIEDESLRIEIIPSASITKGRLGKEVADFAALKAAGAAFFTDDGSYVADTRVMEEAMRRAAALDMAICDHAVDPKIQGNGVIRDCPLARRLGLPIIPPEAESAAIERDISLCRTTGCRLHIQHISTAKGVELVRAAQREGLPVTAEVTPHHILFSCEELQVDDGNFKMSPPLGNNEDRAELRKAVKEHVLMFATDHAPHPMETKNKGFLKSANGIVGIEAAIPVTHKIMVCEEGMSMDDWARAWYEMPLAVIRESDSKWRPKHSTVVVTLPTAQELSVSAFASQARNSPYDKFKFDAFGAQSDPLTKEELEEFEAR